MGCLVSDFVGEVEGGVDGILVGDFVGEVVGFLEGDPRA